MTSANLENQTLQQKLSHADHLVRELIELLEHGYIPKTQSARKTAHQGMDSLDEGDITDLTIRSTVETLVKSGDSANSTTRQLILYLNSIEFDIQRVFQGG